MSEQPQGGTTGRWLKRITQSMSGEPRDLAELIEDLREASERGLFDGDALVMLEGVLAVADMQVRDIMVPRSQMVFVERDERPDKLVELVVESGHSRFPVIGEDRDQILGILLAKDLLRLQAAGAFRRREGVAGAVLRIKEHVVLEAADEDCIVIGFKIEAFGTAHQMPKPLGS